MRAREYLSTLVARGRYHFTSDDAGSAIAARAVAVREQLRRLRERGEIATPVRGFHVIVPPEYRRLGCLPAEQFIAQLMEHLGEAYYVGLLSAAQRHGAAHQRPQALQVVVRSNRKPIKCGRVRVAFIARAGLERMPITELNTPRGVVRCSTAEVTALDLVGYPNHSGGISNVATVISELAEELDAGRLVLTASLAPVSWSQRLGYLLELVNEQHLADALASVVEGGARSFTPLVRSAATAGGRRIARWKLIVNADVEPDL